MCRATSYPLLTGGVQICALLIRSWPEARRCWNFYSILTDVSLSQKNHIHPFNPKTKFLQTLLNQTSEKKKNEIAILARKFQKQKGFLTNPVKEVWVHEIKTLYTIYTICHILQKSDQNIAMLYYLLIGTAKAFLKYMLHYNKTDKVSWHRE